MIDEYGNDTVVLDDIEINRYEVPVEILLDEYDDIERLESDIEDTTVNAILDHVDAFHLDGEEARFHIASRIEYDTEHVREEFESDDADVIPVETVTQLGQATESAS